MCILHALFLDLPYVKGISYCQQRAPECWHSNAQSAGCCASLCSHQAQLLLVKSQDAAFCLQTSMAGLHVCQREEFDLGL